MTRTALHKMAVIVAAALLLALAGPGAAQQGTEPYRVVSGDVLEVRFLGEELPIETRVDLDGFIALPEIGRIRAAGNTPQELEEAIETRAVERNLFADPAVTVAMLAYAPILVAGDVRTPGTVEFFPGVSASSAVALAGGVLAAGLDPEALTLMEADLRAESRQLDEEYLRLQLRAARIQAQLDGRDALPEDLVAEAREAGAGRAVDLEADILDNAARSAVEITELWRQSLEETEEQIRLFEQRIESQEKVVALQQEELDRARDIVERGLRPREVLIGAERAATDAQTRLLEVQSAYSVALNTRTNRRQDLIAFESNRRTDLLETQRATLTEMEANRARMRAIAERRSMMGGLGYSATADRRFLLTRDGDRREIDPETLLRPGDILTAIIIPQSEDPS